MEKVVIVAHFNVPDSSGDILLPGCIKPGKVMLTHNFNHNYFGMADVKETDKGIVAMIDTEGYEGLYPAIGFSVEDGTAVKNEHGGLTYHSISMKEVSLCKYPNMDQTIQPVK